MLTVTCPKCQASSAGGRFCRRCGAALDAARVAPAPAQPVPAHPAPAQPVPAHPAPAQPHSPNGSGPAAGGWDSATVPAAQLSMPWPAPQWAAPPAQPPRSHDSNTLAVALAIAVLVVVMAIAVAVIVLVANGDSAHTGVLTQSTVTNAAGESQRPATP